MEKETIIKEIEESRNRIEKIKLDKIALSWKYDKEVKLIKSLTSNYEEKYGPMNMKDFHCSSCNKLLGKIEGKAEIKCPRCKTMNKNIKGESRDDQ